MMSPVPDENHEITAATDFACNIKRLLFKIQLVQAQLGIPLDPIT